MRAITIENFKAFQEAININPQDKNMILYGENGAGKSSIYNALKIIFFYDEIHNNIEQAPTPEEQEEFNNNFWSKFNHKVSNRDFRITLNNINHTSVDRSNYNPYLITRETLHFENKLELPKILSSFDSYIQDKQSFCNTNYQNIEDRVNNNLEMLKEPIRIEIIRDLNFNIKLSDSSRNLSSDNDIRIFFNEAKLNLVILFVIFATIEINSNNSTKKGILILDDYVTSLDAANRIVLAKYVIDKFSKFQLFIFTHNVSFYNLIHYLVHDYYHKRNDWKFANIYQIDGKNRLYQKHQRIETSELKERLRNLSDHNPSNIADLGNLIRQKYETLLHELSKLLLVSAVEINKNIINRIAKKANIYIYERKTASDLVDEISEIVNNTNKNKLAKAKIRSVIQKYKVGNLPNIKFIINELELYKKTTLNPLSHGRSGLTAFSLKELENSIMLIDELESSIKDIVNKDTNNI